MDGGLSTYPTFELELILPLLILLCMKVLKKWNPNILFCCHGNYLIT